MKVVLTSGGYDPLHIGHIRCFNEARRLGDYLIVVINGDSWLLRKKGKIFMPAIEREEIIKSFKSVNHTYILNSEKDDVCEAITLFRPQIFAKGGDRIATNTPEAKLCKELGIEVVYNVGGGKIKSSSELLDNYCKKI